MLGISRHKNRQDCAQTITEELYMSVVSMLGSVKHRSRSRPGHGSRGMLPSYKKNYSRHMTHVLWVPLGVEFDGDIHFVIRVHVRS